jgi:uroporphyrinogen decarboxylase
VRKITNISHRDRLETCLAGSHPDRTPVALWRHFPVDDQHPERLARATCWYQNCFDFDLIKVTPSSSYCIKDWGVDDSWNGNPEGTRDYIKKVIEEPEDWSRLFYLDPRKGFLGDQLECLRLLRSSFNSETPILQTIFSPLAQAKNLIGPAKLSLHLRRYPEAIKIGLSVITETTIRFILECQKIGIDGVFYAVQHAQYGLLSDEEFTEFGKFYDLQVLRACQDFWLNMVHLHGEDVMFEQMMDYPVQVINWHDRHTKPTLTEARKGYEGVLCGGLRRWESIVRGTPEAIEQEVKDAILQTGGKRFVLGTGCVTPITAPYGNIFAARHSVE